MDGYAVRADDVAAASPENPVGLSVLGDLPAGYTSDAIVERGQAIRIMTGAPLPGGADTVVPVESTRVDGDRVLILESLPIGTHVRKAGEDVKAGETVMVAGTVIGPAEMGMLASLGYAQVRCFRRAVAGIISTGDELVGVDEELAPGKIRDSNSYTVYGMVREAGAEPLRLGVVKDEAVLLERTILDNLDRVDLFITSGGVSVGDYDMVKDVLGKLGEMNFWKVAMRPGKPQAFGHIRGKPLFGLPGNPVSVMVSFEQFVRPALLKMMGRSHIFRPEITAILDTPLGRKTGRTEFIRVVAEWREGRYHANATGPQGSGILRSMVVGNALAVLPEDVGRLEAGEEVTIQLLR
jgi:molybdopterin molybdotransferase